MRVHMIAALEVQRCYRGHLGRRRSRRRRDWENAEPGPERLRLGLRLIEESKVAFERQQEEIDALHRSQEKALGVTASRQTGSFFIIPLVF